MSTLPPSETLARAFADCALRSASGIVTAVRGKLKRIFCLHEGRLAFAVSNLIEEQFSETLIAKQLISVGELATATVKARNLGAKLNRLLIDEQFLEREPLERVLEEHFRHLLFSTLDWPDGDSSFAAGRPDLQDEITLRLSCVGLLMDYVRHHPPTVDEVQGRVGLPTSRPAIDDGRQALFHDGERSSLVSYLLEHCDGSLDFGAVVSGSPEAEEPTWRAIYGLTLLGVLQLDGARQTTADGSISREEMLARLQKAEGADHYAVLELNASCAADQIREAYYFLARRYHPDRFRTGPLQDLREQIETYFTKVTEAYNTLFDPRSRADYDEQRAEGMRAARQEPEQDAGYLAKQNFRLAKALIEKGRYNDAVTSLRNAIELDGQQATYHLELGRLLTRNPRMRGEAEEHLLEVNRINPALADGYLALGQLYLKTQRNDEAIRLFEETLRWEPGHVEATKQLKALGRKVKV